MRLNPSRALAVIATTTFVAFAVVACTHDFDSFEQAGGAKAAQGDGEASTPAVDGSTVADGATTGGDADPDAGCGAATSCTMTSTTCKATCAQTQATCESSCGGSSKCKKDCGTTGDACNASCIATCQTCAGAMCTSSCN